MKYEPTDLPGSPFLISWISFFIFLPICGVVVWFLIVLWSRQIEPYQAVFPNQQNPHWNNAVPQLQTDPEIDLQTLQDRESARLHAAGWTDPGHAYAKIPIEDAMHLVVIKSGQNQLATLLPPAASLTPLDLQNQKSGSLKP